MSSPQTTVEGMAKGAPQATTPAGLDWFAAALLLLGFAALYLPSYVELARRIWPTDEQGHGPIILAVAAGTLGREGFTDWVRTHLVERSESSAS